MKRARVWCGAMGKLNVALLRYLSKDHFRVLTAVSELTHTQSLKQVVHVAASAVSAHKLTGLIETVR